MMRWYVLGLAIVIGCLAIATPGSAATITLYDRQNCNGYPGSGGGPWFYYCYYSGHVSVQPYLVSCYVGGSFAGSQTGGWINNPNGTFGYAKCSQYEDRQDNTGPYQTQDVAENVYGGLLASGYKNWSP